MPRQCPEASQPMISYKRRNSNNKRQACQLAGERDFPNGLQTCSRLPLPQRPPSDRQRRHQRPPAASAGGWGGVAGKVIRNPKSIFELVCNWLLSVIESSNKGRGKVWAKYTLSWYYTKILCSLSYLRGESDLRATLLASRFLLRSLAILNTFQ